MHPDEQYPIKIYSGDGELIDAAGNVGSAESVLYGDLSDHDGKPRQVFAPEGMVAHLAYAAKINADCFGIPVDEVRSLEFLDELKVSSSIRP